MVFKLQMNAYFYHFFKKEKGNNGASFIRDFISLKNLFYFEGEKKPLDNRIDMFSVAVGSSKSAKNVNNKNQDHNVLCHHIQNMLTQYSYVKLQPGT